MSAEIRDFLSGPNVDWNRVEFEISRLPVATEVNTRKSTEDDPMGRCLISTILSANDPPANHARVIEGCLRSFPDCLVMNVSAFFAACQLKDLSIIQRLIRFSLKRETRGTPTCPYMWILMSPVSPKAAEAIIQAYPQGVLQECQGSTYCLLDRILFAAAEYRYHGFDNNWWEKIVLLLKAMQHESLDDDKHQFHPIHYLLHRVLTRPDFFKKRSVAKRIVWFLHQLRLRHPSLFRLVDDNGDTPLHVVLRITCQEGPGIYAYASEIITILIDSFKQSAFLVTRNEGRLPIFLALENGWPCYEVLIRAFPQALHRRDPITCLYPFQVAASRAKPSICDRKVAKRAKTQGSGGDAQQLDAIYTLLRQDPLQARMQGHG